MTLNRDDLPYHERPKGPPPKLGDRRITEDDAPHLKAALEGLSQHAKASGKALSPFWREKVSAGYREGLKDHSRPQRLPSAPDRVPTKRPQDTKRDWNPGASHD